ncbi:MAG: autotransporter domain-containing protein [Bacteroidales bacterium]
MKGWLAHVVKSLLGFVLMVTQNPLQAQTEREESPELGWHYGLNTGLILPYGKPASFYNGSPQNDNKISLILDNQYYKTIIVQNIGYNYTGYELPGHMVYQPNFSVGFFARYQYSTHSSLFAQTSYSRLTATDVFLLNLDLPQGYSFEPTYLECDIMGQESRTYIDLGYRHDFPSSTAHHLFLDVGFSMNNVKVLKNMIRIKNLEYNIKYSGEHPTGPYSQDPRYDIFQGGIGVGGFVNVGYDLQFNDNVSLEPLLGVNYSQTHLEGYTKPGPSWYFLVRFSFRSFNF